ncbi:Small ribosomal subunit protein [Trichinella spiralis]|uniref:Small ribosomal subunit protein n=1 Tax=Trichinella spiralis TaxID=6334 RepID=A0ABR3K948_TRISP
MRSRKPLDHAATGRQHSESDRAKPAPETCSPRRISLPTPHAGTEVGNPAPMESRDAALKKEARVDRGISYASRDRATRLDPSRAHEAPGSMLRVAEAQKAQVAGLPMRNDQPSHTRTPTLGARLVLPSAADGHMVASSGNEASPWYATAGLEAEKRGSRAIDERPDVES